MISKCENNNSNNNNKNNNKTKQNKAKQNRQTTQQTNIKRKIEKVLWLAACYAIWTTVLLGQLFIFLEGYDLFDGALRTLGLL